MPTPIGLACPAIRTVLITGHLEGDPETDIHPVVEIRPVFAIRTMFDHELQRERNSFLIWNEDDFELVDHHDLGEWMKLHPVTCPWPPEEDQVRLAEHVATVTRMVEGVIGRWAKSSPS